MSIKIKIIILIINLNKVAKISTKQLLFNFQIIMNKNLNFLVKIMIKNLKMKYKSRNRKKI